MAPSPAYEPVSNGSDEIIQLSSSWSTANGSQKPNERSHRDEGSGR